MLVSHLPDGPTAYFKISNVKLTKDMKVIFFTFKLKTKSINM